MSEVKRYDAVHIRYEERNIRYGEGCEVEVVAAYDYDSLAAELADLKLHFDTLIAKTGYGHGGELAEITAKAALTTANKEPRHD